MMERIEPVEGQFDLDIVRQIVRAARERDLKLVILWFGTWKNGHMKYVPRWVKEDHERFPRVRTHDGYEIANLSTFEGETLEADKRAFCAMPSKYCARKTRSATRCWPCRWRTSWA